MSVLFIGQTTTVYFATFRTKETLHDRTTRFKDVKPNICFYDWLQNNREEIAEAYSVDVTIQNCNIFQYTTI